MFNPNFWNNFLTDSNNFKTPICMKGVFNDDINHLKELYFNAFKSMTKEQVSPYGIWLDGGNRNEIKEMIAEGILKPEFENLDDFCKNFFEGYSFGVVAHHTNAYNIDLAIKFYSYLQPLYESLGVGLKGVDLNVFMGNYGWTPFGIHQDGAGENVIHFHLGPGKKIMYLWEPDNYLKIEELDLEKKTSNADFVFEIEAGDLFFMPEGYYHIGYSPDYSTAITSWFCSPTVKVFRDKIISGIFDSNFNEDLKEINEFQTGITHQDNVKYSAKHNFKNVIESIYSDLTVADAINLRIKQHTFMLKSSLNYTWPILFLKNEDVRKLTPKDKIKLNDPFFIEYFIDEKLNKIFIYSCGHELVTENNNQLFSLIELLNGGENITINEFIDDLSVEMLNFAYKSKSVILVE